MGILSRKETLPDPVLSLHLDESCAPPFRPGSVISGHMVLSTSVNRAIRQAQLHFTGKSTTCQTAYETVGSHDAREERSIPYHHEVELFTQTQTFLEDSKLSSKEPCTTHFDFSFPSRTSSDPLLSLPFTGGTTQSNTYRSAQHDLPHSLSYNPQPRGIGPKKYIKRNTAKSATIDYGLQVTVLFDDQAEPYRSDRQTFAFQPFCNPYRQHDIVTTLPMKLYASSRLICESKSLMRSLRDRMSKATPSVKVGGKITVQGHLTQLAVFPFHATVMVSELSGSAIAIESVTMWVESVTLVAVTTYRALKVRADRDKSVPLEREAVDEECIGLEVLDEKRVVRDEGGEKGRMVYDGVFAVRVPSVSPSLKTFNIDRKYRLRVRIAAEMCGMVFEWKAEVGGAVLIGPAACPGGMCKPPKEREQ
ncbi:hypothetical protein DOTSEDRAFT_72241 [Dothistroma septosporum NZE10]|uniref:Arrestin-like N-terminal domain-containing protein n=1 Tax=Dothistroma septosporum (strain NZE10 / CBS 128990) TaxID=675120 RepID=N1PQS8_DOTSN|nr:hypothetical protein DOTSEDRAFT_72241 [Dothistroma septosporum NZE10]